MAPNVMQTKHYYGLAIPLWILIWIASSLWWVQLTAALIVFGYITAVCSLLLDNNTRHRGSDGKFR